MPTNLQATAALAALLAAIVVACDEKKPLENLPDHVGSWRLYSRDDVLPYEHSEDILTLAGDGTWRTSHKERTPGEPPLYGRGSGTYTVDGGKIIFHGADLWGRPVTNTYTWSVDGDVLTLMHMGTGSVLVYHRVT